MLVQKAHDELKRRTEGDYLVRDLVRHGAPASEMTLLLLNLVHQGGKEEAGLNFQGKRQGGDHVLACRLFPNLKGMDELAADLQVVCKVGLRPSIYQAGNAQLGSLEYSGFTHR